MPIYTYTRDLREQDGELARPGDIKDNLQDIQDAVNGLTWINVDRGSLDQFHAKPGESYKEISGRYSEISPPSSPPPVPAWNELGKLSFPVRPDNGVYAFASAAWDATGGSSPTAPRPIKLRLSAKDLSSGGGLGSWKQSAGYNLEANGGSGIVWAYRVAFGGDHEVVFEFAHYGGDSGPDSSRPAKVNLVVFVIDR
tara:strand:+ start:173 stop:763 length:591 start_codon:yes stop_codon:yes gene_type:complete